MRQIKKVEKYGVKFDSRLELYFYELVLNSKIDFTFQNTYTLHPSFKYNKSTVRAMTLTVDFDFTTHGINIIVDTKGFQRNDNKLKWKLLKHKMHLQSKSPEIFLPKNQKECQETLDYIKNVCNLATKPYTDVIISTTIKHGGIRGNKTPKTKTRSVKTGVRRKGNTD
jgi:hypothetical protein